MWDDGGNRRLLIDQIKKEMFVLADDYMFFTLIEQYDQCHVDSMRAHDDMRDLSSFDLNADDILDDQGRVRANRLAYRYRRIRELFSQDLSAFLGPEELQKVWGMLAEIDRESCGWRDLALETINNITSDDQDANLLVSSAQLVPTLGKCMLYGLGKVFSVDQVYSAKQQGNQHCFEQIVKRYGSKCKYYIAYDPTGDADAEAGGWNSVAEKQREKGIGVDLYPIKSVEDILAIFKD